MSILSRRAMLANLTISQWTARRLDRQVTDEVNEAHNASKDAGRYNKRLIDKAALEPIFQITNEARTFHATRTLPWQDAGARILSSGLYLDYTGKMNDLRTRFEREADKFAREYPEHVARRRTALNGLFREADYPSPAKVRSLFAFEVALLPCPDAADFRVDLAAGQADDIRRDIERRMKGALDEAMAEPVRRILETVGHMAERLRAYKPAADKGERSEGVFRDSLVQNVRDLVDLLPAFNLTDDPKLTAITQRMAADLCREDAQALRDNDAARASVADAAEAILAQARQFMA